MKRLTISALMLGARTCAALAEPVIVKCTSEDVMVPGWTSSMTITYSGGESGEIKVESSHVTFTTPARRFQKSTEVKGAKIDITTISGAAETLSAMPDARPLLACISTEALKTGLTGADTEASTLLPCASKTTASPVTVHAEASIVLTPGDDEVGIVTRRFYLDTNYPSGAPLAIETFPRGCKIQGS